MIWTSIRRFFRAVFATPWLVVRLKKRLAVETQGVRSERRKIRALSAIAKQSRALEDESDEQAWLIAQMRADLPPGWTPKQQYVRTCSDPKRASASDFLEPWDPRR